MSESWFHVTDGTALQCWKWPALGTAKARLLIIHGFGEHGLRYDPFAQLLTPAGIEVRTFDQRGHGASPGKRGDLPDPSVLERDVAEFVQRESADGLPLFIWGQSAGGQLAVNALSGGTFPLRGLILTAPWFRLALNPPLWKRMLASWLLKLAPGFTLGTGLHPEFFVHDPEYLQTLPGNELTHRKISPRLYYYLLAGGRQALVGAKAWPWPLLMAHGSDDVVTNLQASRLFYEQAKSPDKTWREFDGGRHDLHHDSCREILAETMISWMLARL